MLSDGKCASLKSNYSFIHLLFLVEVTMAAGQGGQPRFNLWDPQILNIPKSAERYNLSRGTWACHMVSVWNVPVAAVAGVNQWVSM